MRRQIITPVFGSSIEESQVTKFFFSFFKLWNIIDKMLIYGQMIAYNTHLSALYESWLVSHVILRLEILFFHAKFIT